MNQLKIGMLSNHRTGEPHFGQCDGGDERLIFSGTRQITTFKKLPKQAPITAIKKAKAQRTNTVISNQLDKDEGNSVGRNSCVNGGWALRRRRIDPENVHNGPAFAC